MCGVCDARTGHVQGCPEQELVDPAGGKVLFDPAHGPDCAACRQRRPHFMAEPAEDGAS